MFSCTTAHKLPIWCLLKCSADACLKLYNHTYPEIRSFRLTLLAASAVSQFDSDKEQVDVTKVTGRLCKLKANSISFSSTDLCENYQIHTELYSNELTVQLALGIKLLYCYYECLIYIAVLHSIVSRSATFHNNQSITVQVHSCRWTQMKLISL